MRLIGSAVRLLRPPSIVEERREVRGELVLHPLLVVRRCLEDDAGRLERSGGTRRRQLDRRPRGVAEPQTFLGSGEPPRAAEVPAGEASGQPRPDLVRA